MKEIEKQIANLMDWCYKITCMGIGKSQNIEKNKWQVYKNIKKILNMCKEIRTIQIQNVHCVNYFLFLIISDLKLHNSTSNSFML